MNPKNLHINARRVFQMVLLALLLCVNNFAQEFKTVRDGIEYAETTKEIDNAPVKMNLLRLDLTKVRLDVVHAMDATIGLEKTSSIATRHGAFAAINAGFFRIDKSIWEGDDVSALMIDGKIFSEGNQRTSLLISNKQNETVTDFQKIFPAFFAAFKSWSSKIEIDFSGINRERKQNELILYTPEFHRTTLTNAVGTEVIVRKYKVTKILANSGSNIIPPDGFILSADGDKQDSIRKLKIGEKVMVGQNTPFLRLKNRDEIAEDIVSGVPQLIKNGKIEITWQEEKSSKSFVETKHPRTAVAKLKDGKFLMVTVDGRSEASGGIGLEDLAKILLELGATDAMNLDGGGSTTMFLDGKIVNHPSDKEGERKVGDAILVTLRK